MINVGPFFIMTKPVRVIGSGDVISILLLLKGPVNNTGSFKYGFGYFEQLN